MIKIETNKYKNEEELLLAVTNWVCFLKTQGYILQDMYLNGLQERWAVMFFKKVVKND